MIARRVALLSLVVATAVLAPRAAQADAKADATKAFTEFITSLATDKPASADLETFLPPWLETEAVPEAKNLQKLIEGPKVKVLRAVVTSGGKSAWIAAEVKTTAVTVSDKVKNVTLRASGVLVLDKGTWRVRAADLSRAIKDKAAPTDGDIGCGMASNEWMMEKAPPKALVATVRSTLQAIGDGKKHAALVSDDKNTLIFGSAPGEQFSGAAAKGVKKWDISTDVGADADAEVRALAGSSPDSDLMWLAGQIGAPWKFCTMYRGFFVLAKEKSGWKIVHEHYSSPM